MHVPSIDGTRALVDEDFAAERFASQITKAPLRGSAPRIVPPPRRERAARSYFLSFISRSRASVFSRRPFSSYSEAVSLIDSPPRTPAGRSLSGKTNAAPSSGKSRAIPPLTASIKRIDDFVFCLSYI